MVPTSTAMVLIVVFLSFSIFLISILVMVQILRNYRKNVKMKNYSEQDAKIKQDIGKRLRDYCKKEFGLTLEEMANEFSKYLKIDPPPSAQTVADWAKSPPFSFIFWMKKKGLRWEWIMEGKGTPRKL